MIFRLWPRYVQYFCMPIIISVARGRNPYQTAFLYKMSLMLSITGVSYLISLLILANLLSCPFVLLIVPHLIFLALSIVRVFSGIKLWENSMLYSPQIYPGLIISMQLFTKAILLFIFCIEHFLLPHLSWPNNYFSLVWYSPNLPTALLFGGWMSSKIIIMLERVQKRATKFILNDYHSDYIYISSDFTPTPAFDV